MSRFLYPRRISISRQEQDQTLGAQPYSGMLADRETVIASGIAARIQVDGQNPPAPAKLPADPIALPVWKIIFKAARRLVRKGDIITDDEGNRYQVISAYWGPLVTTCRSQLLEA